MSKTIKFNISLSVDGKERVTSVAADLNELSAAVTRIKKNTENATSKFVALNQAVQSVTTGFDTIQRLGDKLGDLTQETRSFATAMAEANTMAGKDAAGLERMKEQVTALSKEVPVARDALAKGLYQVISNGVPEDNMLSFLEASARSSVGGIADLQKVVTVTSTVIKNYGAAWTDAAAIQDKIQLTAKNGVTSFEQLADALPRVSGNAATLGVSIDELLASFATLTGVSGNTAEVSTQLAAIFTALVKPSSEAAKMAEAMGIQFDAAAVKSAGGLQNFLTSLDRSVKAYAASSGVLEQEVYAKLFGSAEALRALIPLNGELAQKFGQNVTAMKDSAGTMDAAFKQINETGEAQNQLFKNRLSAVTDFIASVTSGIRPLLNWASSVGQVVTGVYSLVQTLQILNAAQKLHAATTRLCALTTKAWSAVCVTVRASILGLTAMLRVASAGFRGVAVGATTAKVAVRGFLASTGVGALVVALGFALEKLIAYFSDTADAADGADEAMKRAAQGMDTARAAAEQSKQTFDSMYSQTLARLQSSFAKLRGEWGALRTEAEKRRWIGENRSAFDELGLSVKSLADAENVFVKQTGRVEQAFIRRARAAAAQAALTEEMERQIRLKLLIDGADARVKAAHRVKAGDVVNPSRTNFRLEARSGRMNVGNDGRWRWTEQGAREQNAWANTLRSNGPWSNNQRTALEESGPRMQALTKILTEATDDLAKSGTKPASTAAPSATDGPRQSSPEGLPPLWSVVPAAPITDAVRTAVKEGLKLPALKQGPSVGESAQAFDNYRRTRYDEAQAQVQAVQHDLEIGITGEAEARAKIAAINESLAELGMKPIEIEIGVKGVERVREAFGQIQSGWQSVQGVAGGIEQLGKAFDRQASGWERFASVVDGVLGILSSVVGIAQLLGPLFEREGASAEVSAASKTVEATATGVLLAEKTAELGITPAVTVANNELASSYAKAAAAATFAAHAYIPFAGTGIAAGMVAAQSAAIAAAGQITKFAEGGIAYGPTLGLFGEYPGASRNPEVVAPLDRLRSLIEPQSAATGGKVEFRIKGRELVGVLAREGSYRERT